MVRSLYESRGLDDDDDEYLQYAKRLLYWKLRVYLAYLTQGHEYRYYTLVSTCLYWYEG